MAHQKFVLLVFGPLLKTFAHLWTKVMGPVRRVAIYSLDYSGEWLKVSSGTELAASLKNGSHGSPDELYYSCRLTSILMY